MDADVLLLGPAILEWVSGDARDPKDAVDRMTLHSTYALPGNAPGSN
jgi:hypothetical protein